MIKIIWGHMGTFLFWMLWPVLYVYLKMGKHRSRVLIVCGKEILLVQSWLGTKNLDFPGGGAKRNEKIQTCASRELREEINVNLPDTSFTRIGTSELKSHGLSYVVVFMFVKLSEKPHIKTSWPEIFDYKWIEIDKINEYKVNEGVKSAIKMYKPLEQSSLL